MEVPQEQRSTCAWQIGVGIGIDIDIAIAQARIPGDWEKCTISYVQVVLIIELEFRIIVLNFISRSMKHFELPERPGRWEMGNGARGHW